LFARRPVARCLDVEAIDSNGEVIEVARALGSPGPGRITYRREDVTRARPAVFRRYLLVYRHD
jgi:hypothetical protein